MSEKKGSTVIHPDSAAAPTPAGEIIPASKAPIRKTSTQKLTEKLKSSRKKIIIGLAVAAIAIVGIVWAGIQISNSRSTAAACDPALLNQAAAALPTGKTNQLQQVVSQIQHKRNYLKDENCLFVIASYYVNISDYNNSNDYLKKLEAIDPQGKNIQVTALYSGSIALDNLRNEVNFLKSVAQNLNGGVIPSEKVKK